MKKLLLTMLCIAGIACSDAGIPDDEQRRLDAALATTPRADSLRQLLASTPRGERAAMAWLIARMPCGDRDTMRLDLLRENVAYACRAREEFPWTKALPDSVFRNEVLPYAVVDEVRDGWRRDLYERFAPRVAGCRDLRAALDTVNRILPGVVGVEYNTLREKTNQSPAESMRQGMASCTGLSVLLVDALRAVGIPARFAGTAAWHDDRGNHSWTEVWIDGEWHFTEFYQPAALDRAWFLADAGQATPGDRQHAVYAVSFAPTGDWFPMVWNETSREVHATDVTQRYRDAYLRRQGGRRGHAYDRHVPHVPRPAPRRRFGRPRGGQRRCLLRYGADGRRTHGRTVAGHERRPAVPAEEEPHLHVPLCERTRRDDGGHGRGGRRPRDRDGIHGVIPERTEHARRTPLRRCPSFRPARPPAPAIRRPKNRRTFTKRGGESDAAVPTHRADRATRRGIRAAHRSPRPAYSPH